MMIDLTRLIPPAVQQMAIDATIDFVAEKGKDLLSDEVSNKIASLRSDYGFQSAFKAGLQRAIERFIAEYSQEDEDLTDALTADSHLFEDKAVQATMLKILQHPGNPQNMAQETLVQSFDGVLPNRRNRERVNKAVAYFLKYLMEEVYHLPELRLLYELQFQPVTAESAREQVALQKAPLEATTAMSQDLRSVLLQLTEAVVQQRLLPASRDLQGFGNLAGLKLPRHNLPQPDYQRFVGRKEQLKRLGDLLSPKHRAWVVTIDGIGGIGKSALALEVADSYRRLYDKLPPTERFEAIIWTTAKLTVLTGQGIITRSQSLRTLDDIYSTIAVVLQRENITRARPADQDEIVRQALSQQRTLLIVDNLETVDDERVMAFLHDVPLPTKVIVTTRHRLDVAYPIRVVGMTAEEALHLIADQATLKGLTLLPEQAQKLFERTGGVPLAMVWSVAQMAFGYGVEAVLTRLRQPNNDVAKFCFEAAIERIKDKPAYKLLLALSLFATDASREALGFVAFLPELDRDDGLVELEKWSLVNKEGGRFGLLPLTKSYTLIKLNQNQEIETKLYTRYIYYFVEFCQTHGGEHWQLYIYLGVELANIQLALEHAYQLNMWYQVGDLVNNLDVFLDRHGFWNEWMKYAEMAIEAGTKTNNYKLLIRHKIYGLGFGKFDKFSDHKAALSSIQEAKNLALETEDIDGFATALHNEGFIYIGIREHERARTVLQKSLGIRDYLQDKRWQIRTLGLMGINERNAGNLDEAFAFCTKALKQSEELEYTDQIADNLRESGKILWQMGKFEEAYLYFQKELNIIQQLDWSVDIPTCYRNLARTRYAVGEIEEAKSQAEKSYAMYLISGHSHPRRNQITKTTDLLNAIAQSPNDPTAYLAKCGVHGY